MKNKWFMILVVVVMVLSSSLSALLQQKPALAAPAGTALQFNGSSQYATFGKAAPNSGYLVNTPTWTTTAQKLGDSALVFNGTSQYATFGKATELGAATFTLEVWFNWTGAGTTTSTGTGGLTSAIPLIAKGRGEADASNLDCNYFLGISGGKLAADFEDLATGGNHPVTGNTTITTNTWHHAAVVFDGSWRLYLDGVLDNTPSAISATPRYDSIQHASLGTAITSTGSQAGYFAGTLDEARIWNIARSETDIQSTMNSEVTSASGLIGRWGLNEISGNTLRDSAQPSGLGLSTFTLETWIKRTGAGVATSTGSGGVTGIPLIAKGMAETDGNVRDMNYFLGIRSTDNVLAADFEDVASGANHPIHGATAIPADSTWHHVAVTFDGVTLKLYLDGVQDGTPVSTTAVPRYDSIQHAAIGSALNSCGIPGNATCYSGTGQTAGYFAGLMDEVRVWNFARTATEIYDNRYAEITSATGLIGRWGMNESSGASIADSSTISNVNGALINSPSWVEGFPIPDTTPPDAPTGLTATGRSAWQVDLAWTDNSDNESNFQVERCSGAPCGPYSLLSSPAANTLTDTDNSVAPNTQYCYQVRAVNAYGNSAYSNESCLTPVDEDHALDLTSNTYVTFGDAASLDLSQFTLETWFRRDGAGTSNSTGTSGIANAIPLISNGAPEAETSNADLNYVLCIDDTTDRLCADFEEAAGGGQQGLNHPVYGVTPLVTGQWYHAAVTYDGVNWKLYLNGSLETELYVGQPANSINISPTALGTMIETDGISALGFFDGALDEARIWNSARTEAEIRAAINSQLTSPQPGLAARWGLDEYSGTVVHDTAGAAIDGNIVGSGYSWPVPGAPFNIDFTPPADPTNLSATPTVGIELNLTWTDNSDNETKFEIERSTSGSAGPFTLVASPSMNTQSYDDENLAPDQEYCYRLRAANSGGASSYTSVVCASAPADPNNAVRFGGTDAYLTFGDAAALELSQFTLETWLRRDGTGVTTTTGTSGIPNAVPLISNGAQEAENIGADINYVLCINDDIDVLCADFEEGAGGASPGLNHPVSGVTPLVNGQWYHAAATYDGATWKLYLNGNLETQLAVGQPVNTGNTAATALATSLNTSSTINGLFNGKLDETRIWDYALTQAEIQANMNKEIKSGTGLVARWGMNENSGTQVLDTIAPIETGVLTGTDYARSGGAPITINNAPLTPASPSPLDGATNVPTSPTLAVDVSDPDHEDITVSFYGRAASAVGEDFTLAVIPDGQYYASTYPAIYNAQMDWIVNNQATENIVYVASLGDNVDTDNTTQWGVVDAAYDRLDAANIPYNLVLGNHDGAPSNTANYNTFFGQSRFVTKPTYGGYMGVDPANYDNHFDLFETSGLKFIVIYIEYDSGINTVDYPTLAWANGLLQTYSDRRGIVIYHNLIQGDPSNSFTSEGGYIYDALKANPNLFLILGGHLDVARHRTDNFNASTVYSLRSDYQSVDSRQSGYLRVMRFSPANNMIHVTTYSPTQGKTYDDPDDVAWNIFDLTYDMEGSGPYQLIGAVTLPSGSTASLPWPGLAENTAYEWYSVASDGDKSTNSPIWSFTTGSDNRAPTDIALSNSTVAENAAADTVIGTLSTTDPDVGNTFTYSLVSGAGDTDNASFNILGDNLRASAVFDYEAQNAYSVRVRSADQGGLYYEEAVNITVTNVNEAPDVIGIPDQTIEQGASFATINLDDFISDVDNTNAEMTWTYTGNVELTVDITNRVATITTPSSDWNGSETITFRATDPDALFGEDIATFTVNPPPPTLTARPQADQVEGFQWPLGGSVTLTINDVDLDTQTVVVDPGNPAGTYVVFDLSGVYDLVPGDVVKLTSGTTVKEHTVTALAVTAIDVDANTIAGTTDSTLDVQLWVHPGVTGSFVTVTPVSGAWTADFNPFDLVAGNAGPAVQFDADGDCTWVEWNIPLPYLIARPQFDQVEGHEWALGASVTLSINDVDLSTQTVVVDPNNPAGTYVPFDLSGLHDLVPGDVVKLTSGTTVKAHIITDLAITAIDTNANTISGTTSASFDVQLWVHPGVTGSFITVAPVGASWNADFDPFDLVAGHAGPAVQYEADGDCTWIEWNIPTSTLHVVPSYPEVHGHDWQVGAQVTLIVDDDTDPINGVLFTQTKNADDDPWCGYPCFDLTGVITPTVGQFVTLYDDMVTKTVLVSPLTVTGVDIDNEIVTGTGDPGARVAVNINSQGGIGRWITVTPAGTWLADFSVVGDEDFEQDLANIVLGDQGRAIQLNNDGTDDGTLEYWNVPLPTLTARPQADQVEGFQWPLGVSVTLTINDVDLDTQTVVVDPGNPAGTYVVFDLSGVHDLVPGDVVKLTSGTTVKEHTVTALAVTAIDVDANTIAGTTDSTLDVQLWVHPGVTGSFVTVTPVSGAWTADFNPFDLAAGDAGPAVQWDADGDATWVEWNIPTTATHSFSLSAGWNLITLPLQPVTPYNAETLLQAINAQGASCNEVDQWVTGMWESYPLGVPFGQFPINLGQGYFVKCTLPGSWTMEGNPLTGSVPLSLSAGWNLVGVPYPASGNTAMTVVNGINNQGGACSELVRWVNGAWGTYIDGVPFTDFALLPYEGYFVKCTVPSTYVPQ